MTTSTTDALSGHALDATTEVVATLDIDIGPAARATLERMLALDPRHRALATERTDERVAVSRITARITDAGNYVTRHTIACATLQREDDGAPRRADPCATRRPEQIALELETEDGSTISLDTDLAILPTWGASVRTTTVALTRTSRIDIETLTGILDDAFIANHVKAAIETMNEDARMEHREAAERRATRLLAASTREGDAAARKLVTETVCPGASSADEETENITYRITAIPPPQRVRKTSAYAQKTAGAGDNSETEYKVSVKHQTREQATTLRVRAPEVNTALLKAQREMERDGADWREIEIVDETVRITATRTIKTRAESAGEPDKNVDARAETADRGDADETEYEVTAEQHTREEATLRVRAPDGFTAMHKAQREVERDGADWREIEIVDGTLRMTAARPIDTQHPAR